MHHQADSGFNVIAAELSAYSFTNSSLSVVDSFKLKCQLAGTVKGLLEMVEVECILNDNSVKTPERCLLQIDSERLKDLQNLKTPERCLQIDSECLKGLRKFKTLDRGLLQIDSEWLKDLNKGRSRLVIFSDFTSLRTLNLERPGLREGRSNVGSEIPCLISDRRLRYFGKVRNLMPGRLARLIEVLRFGSFGFLSNWSEVEKWFIYSTSRHISGSDFQFFKYCVVE
ncbi:hypothetical protein CEXT_227491 [Caerostris extrusa]|uniref:Uncharacterized protein n=1 Tax=Caerostris extrusa TaxID=172846 RepID=A0AAV4WMS4_CAEEX|nr:hypothetical protein CEXT_227491 [Caerostris extrusa]